MAVNVYEFIEGDTLPVISGTLKDDAGTVIDITDIELELHVNYDVPLVIPATKISPAAGTFFFPWAVDSLVAGNWEAEIQMTSLEGTVTANKASGKPFILSVAGQIA